MWPWERHLIHHVPLLPYLHIFQFFLNGDKIIFFNGELKSHFAAESDSYIQVHASQVLTHKAEIRPCTGHPSGMCSTEEG